MTALGKTCAVLKAACGTTDPVVWNQSNLLFRHGVRSVSLSVEKVDRSVARIRDTALQTYRTSSAPRAACVENTLRRTPARRTSPPTSFAARSEEHTSELQSL